MMRMLSLCGMKTNKHIRKRHALQLVKRSVAAAALLGCMNMAQAQEGALATVANGFHGLSPNVELARVVKAGTGSRMKPISDDGRGGDALRPVAQLIFALESESDRLITVEVFNEQGRTVQHTVLSARRGRNALTMNVDRLREGRYVALVHEGASARIVRFRR